MIRWWIIACLFALLPVEALAQQIITGGIPLNSCAPGLQDWQVTGMIVQCVRNVIMLAVVAYITLLTDALRTPVGALFTLAVIILGIRIMLGERDSVRLGLGTMIRVSLVAYFVLNMAAFATLPFGILEETMALVTGGWSPWVQIDLSLGKLLGFGPNLALYQGILGLIGGALFSSATGAFMFLFGFMVILALLDLILRAVYTYLNALVLIGFLMAISPLLVPLAVMGFLEQRYVRKWLDMLIAVMLQPVLLFAFLWIFLGLMDSMVGTIFNVFPGGNDFSEYWRSNAAYFSTAMSTDPALLTKAEPHDLQKTQPLVTSLMNPLMGETMDLGGALTHPVVDMGKNGNALMQHVILTFIGMGLVIYLLRALLEEIPRVAEQIAGSSTGLGFQRVQLVESAKKAVSQLAGKG